LLSSIKTFRRGENEKNENWPSFWPFSEKIYSFIQKAFLRFAYFIVDIFTMLWKGMCHQDLEAIGQ
jgi:hypothetical protein